MAFTENLDAFFLVGSVPVVYGSTTTKGIVDVADEDLFDPVANKAIVVAGDRVVRVRTDMVIGIRNGDAITVDGTTYAIRHHRRTHDGAFTLVALRGPVTADVTTALQNSWAPAAAGSGHAEMFDSVSALHALPVSGKEPALFTDTAGVWARYTGTEQMLTASTAFTQATTQIAVVRITNAAVMTHRYAFSHHYASGMVPGRGAVIDLGDSGENVWGVAAQTMTANLAAFAPWETGAVHSVAVTDDGRYFGVWIDGALIITYDHHGDLWTGMRTSYQTTGGGKIGLRDAPASPIIFGRNPLVPTLDSFGFNGDLGASRRWSRALSAADMALTHANLKAAYPGLP